MKHSPDPSSVPLKKRMFPMTLLVLLVCMDAAAWLFAEMASRHSTGEGWQYFAGLLARPWMWIALLLGPLQLWVWTRILATSDLSLAFPLTSLAYPLAVAASVIFFKDELSWRVWAGTACITIGAAFLRPHNTANDDIGTPRDVSDHALSRLPEHTIQEV